MEENCQIFIERLKENSEGKAFDIQPYITLLALDIISETAMGIKQNAQLQSDSDYVKAVHDSCHLIHEQTYSFWYRFKFIHYWTEHRKKLEAALKILHDQTDRVISLRRSILKTDTQNEKRRLAFLDMLILTQAEHGELTDQDIREEVDTFMFAGHDTTGSALGFIIYLLSQHSNIQQTAYEEIKSTKDKEYDHMPYLEAVIKESLRFYTVVPFYSRSVTEELHIGEMIIPKGAIISVQAHILHRNPKYFPQPNNFQPERFLNQSQTQLTAFTSIPFSGGPRNCIGQKYAMLELKVILTHLLQTFEFLPVENFQPEPLASIVMKTGNGIKVALKFRSN